MDGIDRTTGATDVTRLKPVSVRPAAPSAPAAPVAAQTTAAAAISDLFSALADATPPIDGKKVEAIRSLIQTGAYPIDPRAIAAKMVALDFPARGNSADA